MPRYRATIDFDAVGLKDAAELLVDGLDNAKIVEGPDEVPEEEPEDEESDEEATA